jgi:hypothetical protein
MNRRSILRGSLIAVMGLALTPDSSIAQQKTLKEQLVGTWTFVSSTGKLPDGSPVWGSNPKGLLIFTENGRFSSHIFRSDRKKFASNNRLEGTADDNKAAAQATISSFGTYTVNEAAKTYTIRYEGSSYPNQEGTESIRPAMLTGDELKVTNPSPTVGGPPTELLYRRAK